MKDSNTEYFVKEVVGKRKAKAVCFIESCLWVELFCYINQVLGNVGSYVINFFAFEYLEEAAVSAAKVKDFFSWDSILSKDFCFRPGMDPRC